MKLKKVAVALMLMIMVVSCVSSVHALDILNNIFSQADNFSSLANDHGMGSELSNFITQDIMSIVSLIGNLVFAAVTVILGAKYIWSGVDGKTQTKEMLPTFIVGVVFFYLATEITGIFDPTSNGSIGNVLMGSKDYNSLAGTVLGTINLIVKAASFVGLVFIGLKYLFASAEGKSSIKEKMPPVAIGMLLVFSASSIVDFIINAGREII